MRSTGLDRDLVFEFFWRFSAFECALKREGFLTSDQWGNARPDWKNFGVQMEGQFRDLANDDDMLQAARKLIKLAPRRQVVRDDGELGWKSLERRAGESEEEFVILLVKTVRNNLFHGGKYPDGRIDEISRNEAILRASLVVLEGFYDLHRGLARWRRLAA